VAAGLWFAAARWWPLHNPRRYSAEIEAAANRQLFEAGIYDHQILSQVHKERGRWGVVWIESERRIQIAAPAQLDEVVRHLRSVAKQYHCSLHKRDTAESTVVSIKFLAFIPVQRFVLLKSGTQAAPVQPFVKTSGQARVAFVIDDVAYEMDPMDHFAGLGIPLTFAVLPRDKHSRELADKAHHMHFPVILHLPMQPIDLAHNNPGGAGLYLTMTPDQLHDQFMKDVASVPHIVGINNHMGSAFTEDEPKMTLVLGWVKEKGLFFLDSRTSTKSIVPKAAKKVGVACRINETFLDNSDTVEGIETQLDEVLKLALKRHQTIAIGHYRRKHLVEALAKKIPEFQAQGVTFVGLPALYTSH
jgi:uncharacterized protein